MAGWNECPNCGRKNTSKRYECTDCGAQYCEYCVSSQPSSNGGTARCKSCGKHEVRKK